MPQGSRAAAAAVDASAQTVPLEWQDTDGPSRAAHAELDLVQTPAGLSPGRRRRREELRVPRRFWVVMGLALVIEAGVFGWGVAAGRLPLPRDWLDPRVTAWVVLHAATFGVAMVLASVAALLLPAERRGGVWSRSASACCAVLPSLAVPWMLAWVVEGLLSLGSRRSKVPAEDQPLSRTAQLRTLPQPASRGRTSIVALELAAALAVSATLVWPEPWRIGLPPQVLSGIDFVQQAGPWLLWVLAGLGLLHVAMAAGASYWEAYRDGGLVTWLAPIALLAPLLVFLSVAVLTGLGRDVAGPGAIPVTKALRDSSLFWGLASLYGVYYAATSWAAMQRHVVAAVIGYVLCGPVALAGWQTARIESHRLDCVQRLSALAGALRQYASEYGELPPPAVRDATGNPLLSWRVLLLPYLGERELYDRARLDEAWDSAANEPLQAQRPEVFRCEELPWNDQRSTLYMAVVGDDTLFPAAGGVSSGELRGRGEQTVVFIEVERAAGAAWTSPVDVELGALDFSQWTSNHGHTPVAVTVMGESDDLRPERGAGDTVQDVQKKFWRPAALNR
jgi:hypothetical protein